MSATDHTREALAKAVSQASVPNWWDDDAPATYSELSGQEVAYDVPSDDDFDIADAILASPWLAAHLAAVVEGKDAEIERLRDALRCDARHLDVENAVPCHLDKGHDGEHVSTTGCAGSVLRWPSAVFDALMQRDEARAAVDVAVAAERERIAAAIEADDWFDSTDIVHHVPDFREGVKYAVERHAHIARTTGGGDTTKPVDVERIRAAIRLVQPDHLTPMGARIIEKALGGGTDD